MLQLQVMVPPIVALMGLAFLFNTILRHFHDSKFEQIAFGLLFGLTISFGMINPLTLGEGVIFDTRTVLVGAAVAFVGPIAGVIATGIGIICRIVIGGAGMSAGVVGLLLAFGFAYIGTTLLKNRIRHPVLKDFLMALIITSAAASVFVLPYDLAVSILASILPTLIVVDIVGMIAIGFVFRREVNHLQLNKKLVDEANTDSLTNLLNRRGMDAEICATKFDADVGHAMFYFDIDNFKHVNDTYGHGAGDAALAIVAARIKDSIRDEAIFTRHGGDEFSIYMRRLDATDMQAVANRIGASISSQAFVFDGHTFNVSISIGGFWTKNNLPVQRMIDLADAQLLLAKQAGKNRAQIAYDNQGQSAAVA
ncbi:diguanylate cyclase [Yoonia maricola]|uniref:diguanylate cyclase n=1 Tax=Yoonia maricola TaxID=420999 RepID=A0A2M8W5G6_9RHOB|nr:diguanylate cyclase [Yoonia maricola]PJI86154.1 diguanylate cyclase [Yoonia maricola]